MTQAEHLLVQMIRETKPEERPALLTGIMSNAARALATAIGAKSASEFIYRLADHIAIKETP